MPLQCVVSNCSNIASSKKGITVHIISYYNDNPPLAKARRKQWIDFVKTKRTHWKPKKYLCVCSQHFAAEDYTRRFSFLPHQGKRQLVKDETGVVPIPRYSVGNAVDDKNKENLSACSKRKVSSTLVVSCDLCSCGLCKHQFQLMCNNTPIENFFISKTSFCFINLQILREALVSVPKIQQNSKAISSGDEPPSRGASGAPWRGKTRH